jgi:ribosomal protein S27AE
MRLIDADAFKRTAKVSMPLLRDNPETLIDIIDHFPTADRPHGEWEKYGDKIEAYDIAGYKTWGQKRRCTKCGFIKTYIEDFGFYSICPNCGLDMRKEGAEK